MRRGDQRFLMINAVSPRRKNDPISNIQSVAGKSNDRAMVRRGDVDRVRNFLVLQKPFNRTVEFCFVNLQTSLRD